MKSAKLLKISLLLISVACIVTAQQEQQQQQQKPQKTSKKDEIAGKRYREQEPLFKPPPLPVQRKLQVFSGAEHPPSFFQDKHVKAESRQFEVRPTEQQQQQQQQFNNFNNNNNFQQQSNFQQQQDNQFQQRQQFDANQQQQFNNPSQQQFGQNQQQSFQNNIPDHSNFQTFQSRQQEALPTLPPVFIPPNSPVGPPPQLQSPIRNLFRQPEPQFSLAGLLQRFLRLFNLGDN